MSSKHHQNWAKIMSITRSH